MVEIRLKNSKTRRVEALDPINPGKVSMYLCGPTVYDRAHLGNARSAVVFDQLFRLLRHEYGAENVTFVRNFTDVDDKINARAAETGREIADITAETSQWYLDDMAALGVLEPTHMPRATGYIPQMVAFIEDLMATGHAYAAEGHVLFSVKSFDAYGALSGRSVDDMIAGSRVEVAPYKRDPMDFVLWKPSSDDIPGWAGPVWEGKSIGRGRPGWHIECSAMAQELLGKFDPEGHGRFDIHGGGSDLLFPHHENEVAQSCAAGHDFAQIWMHNEMLQVEGKKMSKSLGNFFTVRDLLEGRGPGGQGIPGEVIRFVLLSTHYGKPMDWTERKVAEAEKRLNVLAKALKAAIKFERAPSPKWEDVPEGIKLTLVEDLDTHGALLVLHALAEDVIAVESGEQVGGSAEHQAIGFLTGLKLLGLYELLLRRAERTRGHQHLLDPIEVDLSVRYYHAKQTKDFTAVDALKSALTAAGVEVRMSKDGVDLIPGPDFDPAKLEGL